MLAVSYNSFFAGTFINSYNIRTYVAGVQRYWVEKHPSVNVTWQLGYRLGLMYGYQIKGSTHLINKPPIFPAFEVISDLTYKHIGLELSWTDVVITGSLYVRF